MACFSCQYQTTTYIQTKQNNSTQTSFLILKQMSRLRAPSHSITPDVPRENRNVVQDSSPSFPTRSGSNTERIGENSGLSRSVVDRRREGKWR